MIAVATTRAHIEGYSITAYRGTAKGATFAELLQNAKALYANAVLNVCFDDALDVDTLYHGAAVLIKPVEAVAQIIQQAESRLNGSPRDKLRRKAYALRSGTGF